MENKRPFAPGFVNKLDKHLLLNKPGIWTARTHLVVYYGLLFIAVLSVICFLVHDDPRERTNIYVWSFFTGVLSAIGFIIWLIYLLRFNVFKRFGIVEKGDKIKTFALYFISVAIMVAAIYIPSVIESIKANYAYGNEEIVKDVNEMNLAICVLNKGSLPVKWASDTCLVRNNVGVNDDGTIMEDSTRYNDRGEQVYGNHGSNYYVIDTSEAERKRFETDSVVKINDSVYIFYQCPSYDFVKSYGSQTYSNTHQLRSFDIYKQVFQNAAPVDKDKLQARLQFLLKKYKTEKDVDYSEVEDGRTSGYDYTYRMDKKYGTNYVSISINNITEHKYRWRGFALPIFIRVFFYATLSLTLFVFIFRHSTVKTFFLSLLSGIILLILTTLFLTLVNTRATGTFICCLVYFFVFLVLASTIYYSKVRNAINGIGLNFTVFFTAFIPLLFTALYYELLRNADDSRRYIGGEIYRQTDVTKYENENIHYLFAEIIGFIVLLVLIETVFKKLYRTWYALPEA